MCDEDLVGDELAFGKLSDGSLPRVVEFVHEGLDRKRELRLALEFARLGLVRVPFEPLQPASGLRWSSNWSGVYLLE